MHSRGLSRLMAVMFVMQAIVGGFCLLTAEAHAMAQSVQTQDVRAHCAKNDHAADQHSHEDSGNCYHCDQPDELSNVSYSSFVSVALVLKDIITLPAMSQFDGAITGLFSTRTPTGPPRSSSLLFSTTQRIRV